MKRKKLKLRLDQVRLLTAPTLDRVRGAWQAETDECQSAYTYCYKYCSD